MKSYSNDTDEPVILKTLNVMDDAGKIHYYEVTSEELDSYNYWKEKFDLTEGKELSWDHEQGRTPINGPDGFYIVLGSGGSAILEVQDNQIVHKEYFGSGNAYIWSHIDKYYEEKQKETDAEVYTKGKSLDVNGTMRIEGAEIS